MGSARWLAEEGTPVGELRAKVPVSLHHAGEDAGASANRDSFLVVDLALDRTDPVERLRAISAETEDRKRHHDAEEIDALLHDLARVSRSLERLAERWATRPRVFAVNVSNVPGPRGDLSLLGAPVREVHSLAEVANRHALRVSAFSAGGLMSFGLCADADVVGHLDAIASGVERDLDELRARARSGVAMPIRSADRSAEPATDCAGRYLARCQGSPVGAGVAETRSRNCEVSPDDEHATFWNRAPRALRPTLLVAALVIAAALGACGGESEEDATQEIEEVIIGYGDSDGAAACDFLSASALDQLGGESGCSRQYEGVPPAELEVGEVEVDDDTATAQVTNPGQEGSDFELELVDEDGEWKISMFPGLETIAPRTLRRRPRRRLLRRRADHHRVGGRGHHRGGVGADILGRIAPARIELASAA